MRSFQGASVAGFLPGLRGYCAHAVLGAGMRTAEETAKIEVVAPEIAETFGLTLDVSRKIAAEIVEHGSGRTD